MRVVSDLAAFGPAHEHQRFEVVRAGAVAARDLLEQGLDGEIPVAEAVIGVIRGLHDAAHVIGSAPVADLFVCRVCSSVIDRAEHDPAEMGCWLCRRA